MACRSLAFSLRLVAGSWWRTHSTWPLRPIPRRLQTGLEDYLGFFAVALAASLVSIVVAVWRMRPVACRGDATRHAAPGFGLLGRLSRALPGPSLDGNPVLWREWHRLRPSTWMIALGLFVWGATTVTCVFGAYWHLAAWHQWVAGLRPRMIAGLCRVSDPDFFRSLDAVGGRADVACRKSGNEAASTSWSRRHSRRRRSCWANGGGHSDLCRFWPIGPGLMALALATARLTALPAQLTGTVIFRHCSDNSSLGIRLVAAALIVATILTYGAALTSLGLALATWIKRPKPRDRDERLYLRARGDRLANSRDDRDQDAGLRAGALSPIYSAVDLGEELSMRSDRLGSTIWWVGLWDVAAAATAIGLCWLTVRTFDDAFGRIPERPRTSHWMADVVVVVAGVTAAACLVKAVAIWVQGVYPHSSLSSEDDIDLSAFILIELLA